MDWIHCNGCCIQPGDIKGLKFWITGCGHMYCNECLLRGPNNTYGCKLCKKVCSVRLLTPANLQGEVKEYFNSIDSILQKCIKVMDFQNDHRQKLVNFNKTLSKKCNKIQEQCKEYYSQIQHLQQKIAKIQKENMKLKQLVSTSGPAPVQFASQNASPYFVNKEFSPRFTSQKDAHPKPAGMKVKNVFGLQRTPDSLHFLSPSVPPTIATSIDERTPDYVSALRKFSFAYPSGQ